MNLKGDLSKNYNQNREQQWTVANEYNNSYKQVDFSNTAGGINNGSTTKAQPPKNVWIFVALAAGVIVIVLAFLLVTGAHNNKGYSYSEQVHTPEITPYNERLPSPTPKSENDTVNVDELNASVFNGNLASYSQIGFTNATATSMSKAYDGSTFYYPAYAIDGEVSTSWQEGVEGYGIGETLTLKFGYAQDVEVLSFVMGSHTDKNYYEENGKPRQIRFAFSDGSSFIYEFPQVSEQYTIILNRPVTASWISLTIVSTYPGSKFEDTAIAEVEAFSKGGGSTNQASDSVTETEYYSNGAISKTIVSYPKDGVKIIKEYYQDGTLKSTNQYYDDKNYDLKQFNPDGTIAYYICKWSDPYNGFEQFESKKYEYINGVLVKKTTIQHEETYITEYDTSGKLIRETHIDINGKTTVKEH